MFLSIEYDSVIFVFYFFKIESLKVDLGKKDAALTASETKLETLKAHQANQQEHISVLQTSLSAKEHHIKNLQSEVCVPLVHCYNVEICCGQSLNTRNTCTHHKLRGIHVITVGIVTIILIVIK